jgi:micrococcal nuclease
MKRKSFLSIASLSLIIFGIAVLFSSSIPVEHEKSAQKVDSAGEVSGETYFPEFEEQIEKEKSFEKTFEENEEDLVLIEKVIDGDTVEIEGGKRVRYIGIDTPETVDPRKPVQCYGKEASNRNKQLVEGKKVYLEKDISDTDKYGRLLRYIWLPSVSSGQAVLVNEVLVKEGYAYSSAYPPDIKYQERFDKAQRYAQKNNNGMWRVCNISGVQSNKTPSQNDLRADECLIKGNISSGGGKIYHLPNQKYYDKVVIDESKGERWFCSEKEAVEAGWRNSKL